MPGDLVLWDARTIHCGRRASAEHHVSWRMAIYLGLWPAERLSEEAKVLVRLESVPGRVGWAIAPSADALSGSNGTPGLNNPPPLSVSDPTPPRVRTVPHQLTLARLP